MLPWKSTLHRDCANLQSQEPLEKDLVYLLPGGDSVGGLMFLLV
jgi:hypothetical protein